MIKHVCHGSKSQSIPTINFRNKTLKLMLANNYCNISLGKGEKHLRHL